MRRGKPWTTKEIKFLLKNYHDMSNIDLAKKMGRTRQAVIAAYNKFRPEDKKEHKKDIYAYYKNDELKAIGTIREIAKKLNMKEGTLYVYHSDPTRLKNIKVIKVERLRKG